MSDADERASRYLLALGSNRRHHRYGAPRRVIAAALEALDARGLSVERSSPVIETAPLGPSHRRYANAAAIVATPHEPDAMLNLLKRIERDFGRRRGGRRWLARVLDLDIVLWSGGAWVSPGLVVPHPAFRERQFVLWPASRIAGDWRDPLTGLAVRHLLARLTANGAVPR